MVEKIDHKHSDADFLRDLEKATSDKARKKLGLLNAVEDEPEHRPRRKAPTF